MIKAQELRIGNLVERSLYIAVLDNGVKYGVISHDMIRDCQHYKDNWAFKGIFLTEEWLIELGFEPKDSYYNKFFDSFNAEFRLKQNGDGYACRLKRNNNISWICNVTYLHQLQNLYFALTGTELEIKSRLPACFGLSLIK